jgi:S-DNA-T family DNA segregation ATPase FtsK/SpoIIIE
MSMLMRNQLAFKKRYILKIYDDITRPSAVVGSAGHRALQAYYNGKSFEEAKQAGLDYINNQSDTGIDYGKTGSREQIINTFNQAINFYFEELPKYHEILGVEEEIVTPIEQIDGQPINMPAKSFSDLITRNAIGEIEIIDHKFVKFYSDPDVDVFSHFLQGMFNYHTIKAKYGEAPKRIIFNECKTSKNKDGKPQIQPYTIEFEGLYGDFATFYKLYDSCTKVINNPEAIFLPNPHDIFDGQNSFEVFRSGVIGVERPVVVKHKTEQVAFSEKAYVASAGDRLENKNLTAEERIRLKLQEFGVSVEMQETHVGPSVTQYTFKTSKGVPMSKVAKLDNDLALALEAEHIRIEAPIRGTSLVGVEVPNKSLTRVDLAERHFKKGTLNIPIGMDVYGETVYGELSDMPHLLIAGATGSGKSVMLNVILRSLTTQMPASKLKLALIDPKRVELSQFADLPHVMGEVVYDVEPAVKLLMQLNDVMDARYITLAKSKVRRIEDYEGDMPRIVVVVDEFADLMLTGGNQKLKEKRVATGPKGKPVIIEDELPSAEQLIVRLAQKARAIGIYLVLATQRPSAEVVTGLIKANIPTKIAFMTTSKVNSQIIIDQPGAEELSGKGDMLYMDPGARGLKRLQGLYA